ncbi:unnamed protein product [Bursaphelenchus okinawaensis]|uniref:Uncharacterized protein n=1 Tax=Bursaphelenchus okinawaensis TaxID=465554 RepID=A0A811LLI3_9BILA|nr:unnamed protein product [Bursaphelenchus okinawaensis]CAG9125822.1 unnamed protein product [Bursaphelenchus okinawaensis]
MNEHNMNEEKEVNFGQLFSDVSRTVDKVRSMFNGDAPGIHVEAASPMVNDTTAHSRMSSGSPLAGLFGGQSTCFKTCGMEDIQIAAKRAGDLFVTLQTCTIILTAVVVTCMVVTMLVGLLWFYRHERRQSIMEMDQECSTSKSTVLPRYFKDHIFGNDKDDDNNEKHKE